MLEHTSQLSQYGVVIGRRMFKYRRPKKKGQNYTAPDFIGVDWFRTKKDAEAAKAKFDKKH